MQEQGIPEAASVFSMEMEKNYESPLFTRRASKNFQQLSDAQTSSYDLKDLRIDLENWMGCLPEHLTKIPIIYLAIPGSHNSFSYSISPNSKVSPDSPLLVQNLGKWCKPIANRIIFNWSQGQKEDVIQQLHAGIRYFDVRLVMYDNEILISHGLYGGQIQGFLEEINSFLDCHVKEVVILDFQHFYEFEARHHERMISMMLQIFSSKICHRERRMRENTLHKLWECKNQLLIIYRDQVTRFYDIFWPSGTWATPWPNKVKVRDLIEYLNNGLSNRKEGMGYVTQGILTPTTEYIALHVFGSLKKLSAKANKGIISWLESKSIGANGVNVVICDFIERYNFCEKVILLNYKGENDYLKNFVRHIEDIEYQEAIKY